MKTIFAVVMLVGLLASTVHAQSVDARGCPPTWDVGRSEWRWMTDAECTAYLKSMGKGPAPAPVERWFAVAEFTDGTLVRVYTGQVFPNQIACRNALNILDWWRLKVQSEVSRPNYLPTILLWCRKGD